MQNYHYQLFKLTRFFINIFNFFKEFFVKRNVGINTIIGSNVHILGWNNIVIGDNSIISDNCWLNVNHRIKENIGIDIGNHCYISKGNVISCAEKVIIRDYFMSNVNVCLLGSNHIISNPMKPYISTGAIDNGILYIGTNVWIGANTQVLGSISIGHGSVIGAGSVITKSIPPFSIAVGNPAQVIKRFSFLEQKWVKIEQYNSDEQLPDEEEYIIELSKITVTLPSVIAGKFAGDI